MTLSFETTPIDAPQTLDAETLARRLDCGLETGLIPALEAGPKSAEQLRLLVSGEALCVTTGQQPGLFTGPLFTIYKALTAIATAEALQGRLGRPVVPVFWVAGDDHDLAEANHTYFLNGQNDVVRLELGQRPSDAPLVPLYREALGPDIVHLIRQLADETPETEFKQGTLDWLNRHYHPESDFATAFVGAMRDLLDRHGIVFLRAYQPTAKAAFADVVLRALDDAEAVGAGLQHRAQELQEDGRPIPVNVDPDATLVMVESFLGRDRIIRAGTAFRARRSGEQWTAAELHALVKTHPERLSPNVLLRPVVEAASLPTVAYVAGPGELAYFPQAVPVYDILKVAPQPAFPRWSGRAIEPKAAKVLAKFSLSPDDLSEPEGQLEGRIVRGDLPSSAAGALESLRGALAADYEELAAAAAEIDPTLRKPAQNAQNAALRGLSDFEKRMVGHLKKRNEVTVQQLAKARRNLFPNGKPQERMFNVVPYLVRYGEGFVDLALASCRQWARALETTSSQA